MASNPEEVVKEIVPFTYSEIEAKVKQILLSKGMTDIQYPGSNISQLADIMTYLVSTLNTNTAVNLQEVILQLATKRMNVLFGGRQLGYEAVQRTSYVYRLDISINRNNDIIDEGLPSEREWSDYDTFNLLIPRYTIFESDGNKYYYMGQDIYIQNITNLNRFEKGFSIDVKEGDLLRYKDNEILNFRTVVETVDNITKTKQNYLIPYNNIEDDGIELWLTYIDDNGTNVVREYWSKHQQFLVDSTFDINKRKFVTLQNIFLQMPSVFFEIGGYGNPLRLNTLIQANVLLSKGAEGKAKGQFTPQDITIAKEFSVQLNRLIHEGTEVESMDSIKQNAPIFHNSANRAVTALDYVAITQRHEAVKTSYVWGVEEEFNEQSSQATVLFSFLPKRTIREFASTEYLSESNPVGEDNSTHLQYDLQYMPRHPLVEWLPDPDTVTPARPEPVSPKFQTRPVNYLPRPDGYDTFEDSWNGVSPNPGPQLTPPDPIGEKPLIPVLEERNQWFKDSSVKGNGNKIYDPLPKDWVEIPPIPFFWPPSLGGAVGYTDDYTQNRANGIVSIDGKTDDGDVIGFSQVQAPIFKELQNEYSKTILGYQDDGPVAGYATVIDRWHKSFTTNLDYIPNSKGGSFNTGVTAPPEPVEGTEELSIFYKTWLKSPNVIKYLDWLVADYRYRKALSLYNEYQSQLSEYKSYKEYLETPEGSAYTINYKNTLDPAQLAMDNAYNEFLDDQTEYENSVESIFEAVFNWYLTRDEVYNTPNTPDYLIDGSVFTELEAYKIMTMNHESRDPSYCNFDFVIKVIKYDLSRPASETNAIIFKVVDDYFKNYVETLGFEYFASNLQRRIDEALGDSSGIEVALTNDLSISYNMMDEFKKIRNQEAIIIRLAFPYENLYEVNGVTFDGAKYLPSIDTKDFTLNQTKFKVELPHYTFIDWSDKSDAKLEDVTKGQVVRKRIPNEDKTPITYEPSEFYRALTDLPAVRLNTADYTNDNLWLKLLNEATDVEVNNTIRVELANEIYPNERGTFEYGYAGLKQTDVYLMDQFADDDLSYKDENGETQVKWITSYKNKSSDYSAAEADATYTKGTPKDKFMTQYQIVRQIDGVDSRYFKFLRKDPETIHLDGEDYQDSTRWQEIIDSAVDIKSGDVVRWLTSGTGKVVEYYLAFQDVNDVKLIETFSDKNTGFFDIWVKKIDPDLIDNKVIAQNYEIVVGEKETLVNVPFQSTVLQIVYEKGVYRGNYFESMRTAIQVDLDLESEDYNNTLNWTNISPKVNFSFINAFSTEVYGKVEKNSIIQILPYYSTVVTDIKYYKAKISIGYTDITLLDYNDSAKFQDLSLINDSGNIELPNPTTFTIYKGNSETLKDVPDLEVVQKIKIVNGIKEYTYYQAKLPAGVNDIYISRPEWIDAVKAYSDTNTWDDITVKGKFSLTFNEGETGLTPQQINVLDIIQIDQTVSGTQFYQSTITTSAPVDVQQYMADNLNEFIRVSNPGYKENESVFPTPMPGDAGAPASNIIQAKYSFIEGSSTHIVDLIEFDKLRRVDISSANGVSVNDFYVYNNTNEDNIDLATQNYGGGSWIVETDNPPRGDSDNNEETPQAGDIVTFTGSNGLTNSFIARNDFNVITPNYAVDKNTTNIQNVLLSDTVQVTRAGTINDVSIYKPKAVFNGVDLLQENYLDTTRWASEDYRATVNTPSSPSVTTVIGDILEEIVGGVVIDYHEALTVQTNIDIEVEDLTNVTNWKSVEDYTTINNPAQPVTLVDEDLIKYSLIEYTFEYSYTNSENVIVPITVNIPSGLNTILNLNSSVGPKTETDIEVADFGVPGEWLPFETFNNVNNASQVETINIDDVVRKTVSATVIVTIEEVLDTGGNIVDYIVKSVIPVNIKTEYYKSLLYMQDIDLGINGDVIGGADYSNTSKWTLINPVQKFTTTNKSYQEQALVTNDIIKFSTTTGSITDAFYTYDGVGETLDLGRANFNDGAKWTALAITADMTINNESYQFVNVTNGETIIKVTGGSVPGNYKKVLPSGQDPAVTTNININRTDFSVITEWTNVNISYSITLDYIDIFVGDTVGVTNIVEKFYTAIKDRKDIILLQEKYDDINNWKEAFAVGGIVLVEEFMDKVQPYFDYNWQPYSGEYDPLMPEDLYCEREVLVPGSGSIKPIYGPYVIPLDPGGQTFSYNSAYVSLPIYLGDSENQNPGFDRVVGEYVIRNEQYQVIDVELYFDYGVGGSITSGRNPKYVGVPLYPGTIGPDIEAIPSFLTFTDYGYSYVDLVYPSNIDSNSDNIPFTTYTMPRLRQVRFDVQ